jgi:hypothetical protein
MIDGSLDVRPEGRIGRLSHIFPTPFTAKQNTSYYFILIYVILENCMEFNGCVRG